MVRFRQGLIFCNSGVRNSGTEQSEAASLLGIDTKLLLRELIRLELSSGPGPVGRTPSTAENLPGHEEENSSISAAHRTYQANFSHFAPEFIEEINCIDLPIRCCRYTPSPPMITPIPIWDLSISDWNGRACRPIASQRAMFSGRDVRFEEVEQRDTIEKGSPSATPLPVAIGLRDEIPAPATVKLSVSKCQVNSVQLLQVAL